MTEEPGSRQGSAITHSRTLEILGTSVLLIIQVIWALLTLLVLLAFVGSADRCGHSGSPRPCHVRWRVDSVMQIAAIASAILIAAAAAAVIRRVAVHRSSYWIPLVCCGVQLILVVVTPLFVGLHDVIG